MLIDFPVIMLRLRHLQFTTYIVSKREISLKTCKIHGIPAIHFSKVFKFNKISNNNLKCSHIYPAFCCASVATSESLQLAEPRISGKFSSSILGKNSYEIFSIRGDLFREREPVSRLCAYFFSRLKFTWDTHLNIKIIIMIFPVKKKG